MPSATQQRSIDDGLVLHLPMNEGIGAKIFDRSQYGNHGDITGVLGDVWANTKDGMAIATWDGVGDYLEVPAAASFAIQTGTVALFAKVVSEITGHDTIIYKGDGASYPNMHYAIKLLTGSNKFMFVVADGIDYDFDTGQTPYVIGTEYHLALTFDGSTVKFYNNGRLDMFIAQTITVSTDLDLLRVGRNNGINYPCNCETYETRVYNRVLVEQEIHTLSEMRRRI